MHLISIVGRPCSGIDRAAMMLCQRLGYRWIGEETLIELAAAWGPCQADLREALPEPGLRVRGRRRRRRLALRLLRAALAREAAGPERAVICGDLGYLVSRHEAPLLRVRIDAPMDARLELARERLGLTGRKAERFLRAADRSQDRLVRDLAGRGWSDPAAYDLIFRLQEVTLEPVCASIAALCGCLPAVARDGRREWPAVAVTSRAEAELSKLPDAGRDTAVTVEGGVATLSRRHWTEEDYRAAGAAMSQVPGIERVVFEKSERQPPPAWPRLEPLRLWPAAVALAVLLALTSLVPLGPGARAGEPALYAGIITDTRCRAAHTGVQDAECVKACVRNTGARYALFDGTSLYTVSNQAMAEAYAARTVEVFGIVNRNAGTVQVRSIELAP